MENVLLVVHILTCIGLIGVVLLQRSEGGALGIGGGGGGGLMSGRGAASVLTRTTMILAAVFFSTSLALTTLATRSGDRDSSVTDVILDGDTSRPVVTDELDLFDDLDTPVKTEPEDSLPSDSTPGAVPAVTPTPAPSDGAK